MEDKDYYTILGVGKNASHEEIKTAYKKLALQYHPDRCPEEKKKECEEKFKEIAAAYYVLGDPQRKKEYDDYRHGTYVFRSGHGSGDFASQSGFDFNDLMRHFRVAGAGKRHQKGGYDRYVFFDDLADIFGNMRGSVHANSDGVYTVYSSSDMDGLQKIDTDYNVKLNIPRDIAEHGGEVKFKLSDNRTITLRINPGTKNGQKLRLKGLGSMCHTCDHKGDLIVTVIYS
ncbi:MAG: DnaJ domain-containing protein [Elusimicrobia bacterium]|nr:DnaJ domain-containing protein [Elusimicrobiota bacterium]